MVGIFIANFNKTLYVTIKQVDQAKNTSETYKEASTMMSEKIKNATVFFCDRAGNQQILSHTFRCNDVMDFITPDPGTLKFLYDA